MSRARVFRRHAAAPASRGAAALAAVAVAAAAAIAAGVPWRRDAPQGARPCAAPSCDVAANIAAGVRRLRAATVGDVAPDGSPDSAASASTETTATRRAGAASGAASGAPRPAPRRAIGPRDAARRAAGALTPGVPWWADSAHWGADVVRWTETTRAPLVVDAGDTVTVTAPALPAALPAALRRRGVWWHADGAVSLADAPADAPAGERVGAHAGVPPAVRVVAREPGVASVQALSAAGRTVTPVRVRPAVRGRVLGVTDGGAVGGVPARVLVARRGDGGAVDTAQADADGRFRLALPEGWDGIADVRVEPPADAARGGAPAHVPVVIAGVPAARLHRLGVVLPPTRWTIAAGRYAGVAVRVEPAAARGFWRAAAAGRPVGWADERVRSVAVESLGAADTAAFWAAARELAGAWGRPLFRPAAPGEAADVVLGVAPSLAAAAVTTLSYGDGDAVVGGARVDFRSPAAAADARVAAHELLHVLGFGHARGWPSLVGLAGSRGPAAATPADVAHGQLFGAIRRAAAAAVREYGAALGWAGGRP